MGRSSNTNPLFTWALMPVNSIQTFHHRLVDCVGESQNLSRHELQIRFMIRSLPKLWEAPPLEGFRWSFTAIKMKRTRVWRHWLSNNGLRGEKCTNSSNLDCEKKFGGESGECNRRGQVQQLQTGPIGRGHGKYVTWRPWANLSRVNYVKIRIAAFRWPYVRQMTNFPHWSLSTFWASHHCSNLLFTDQTSTTIEIGLTSQSLAPSLPFLSLQMGYSGFLRAFRF